MVPQEVFHRENWLFIFVMIAAAVTYISLFILILAEARESNQFLRATEIVVTGVLSLLLVILYFRQNSILDTQTDIQEEQTNIIRATETPEIVMNEFRFFPKSEDLDHCRVGAEFTNTGGGLAKNFEITTKLILPIDSEIEGGGDRRGLKREENSDIRSLSGDYIRSGEMGEPLTAELNLTILGSDWMRTCEFEEAVEILTDRGIEKITLSWDIEWTDAFGRTEDLFGNEYKEQYHHFDGEIEEGMTFDDFIRQSTG